LAEASGWTVGKVRAFLNQLRQRQIIRTAHSTGRRTDRCVVTLCNYDYYQAGVTASGTPDRTPERARSAQIRTTKTIKTADAVSPPEVPPARRRVGEQEPAAPPAKASPEIAQPGAPAPDSAAAFDTFSAAYPHIVDEPATCDALARALEGTAIDEIVAGAERYAAWLAVNDNEPPMNSANWLRRKRWLDRLYIRPQPPAHGFVADFGQQNSEILIAIAGGPPWRECPPQRRDARRS